MDNSHLYMFVDYDGVIKTYAENFSDEFHHFDEPFSASMIRVLSNIARTAGLPAYFIPISSSPGSYSKEDLARIFKDTYRVNNLELHPQEEIVPVRNNRTEYITNIIKKYNAAYHLILDDEFHWYEGKNLNYFRTDTFDGICFKTFLLLSEFAEQIHKQKAVL